MKFSQKAKSRLRTRYGKWAVITGASSGIGRALATRCAEAGLNVVLAARRQDLLDALAASLQADYGVVAMVVACDLAESEGLQRLQTATSALDVGLFIASAGFGTSGRLLASSVHAEANMLRVNCEALLVLTHHYGQRFVQRGRGGIVLLSSMVAFQGVPFAAHYAATKAYVQSLAEGLRAELKPFGVDVLAAAPGPVSSGFEARANMRLGKALRPEDIAVPILHALGRRTTVLPGGLTKLLVYSLRTVPRWGKIRIMQAVMGGMTKHQRAT